MFSVLPSHAGPNSSKSGRNIFIANLICIISCAYRARDSTKQLGEPTWSAGENETNLDGVNRYHEFRRLLLRVERTDVLNTGAMAVVALSRRDALNQRA